MEKRGLIIRFSEDLEAYKKILIEKDLCSY
jgi:hypothetical protein